MAAVPGMADRSKTLGEETGAEQCKRSVALSARERKKPNCPHPLPLSRVRARGAIGPRPYPSPKGRGEQ